MKFWKILRNLLDEIFPDWQDKFISYKDLKKQLKLLHPLMESSKDIVNDGDQRPGKRPRLDDDKADGGDEEKEVTEGMDDFFKLLEGEIKKFNKFFMDKEEDYIIRLKALKDYIAEARDSEEEVMKVGQEMVDFHGEMILLENYSALNYTGLLKILKKYDKRSGDLIRMPFIQKVLHEPFFRTDLINKLVKECETIISSIFSRHEQLAPPEEIDQKEGCSEQGIEETANHVRVPEELAEIRHEQLAPPEEIDQKEGCSEQGIEETANHIRVPEELAEIECMENMYLRLSISALRALKQIRSGSSTQSMFSLPPMDGNDLLG